MSGKRIFHEQNSDKYFSAETMMKAFKRIIEELGKETPDETFWLNINLREVIVDELPFEFKTKEEEEF